MHDRLPHRAFSRIGLVNWLETPGLGPAAPFSDQVGPRPQATPLWHGMWASPSPASESLPLVLHQVVRHGLRSSEGG
jgi:hypothetical protein